VDERHLEVPAERLDDLLCLVLPQQAVVDEDTRELVADRLVHEESGDRGVDAPRERTQHPLAADLLADARRLLLDHRGGRPRRRRVGDAVEEVLEDLRPVRRVHDLRVELNAVYRPCDVLEDGDRRRGRAGDDARPGRRGRDGIAVAHPDRLLERQPGKKLALPLTSEVRLAELRDARSLDSSAELPGHELHPIADAEHRDAELEEPPVDSRRAIRVDGRRPAGEHERARAAALDVGRPDPVGHELGVDPALADAPRDQLRVLTPEIDHEDRPLLGFRGRDRQPHHVTHGDSSARPS
jgi:hypothetical protein